ILGTPSLAGTYNFTVTATDYIGATASQNYSITVNPTPTPNPASLVNWPVNQPGYSQTITGSAGTGAFLLGVTNGALPDGLSLNPLTGEISGTPTAANTFRFTVTARDNLGATGSRVFTITIVPNITISTPALPDWTLNKPYRQTVGAGGGTGLYT